MDLEIQQGDYVAIMGPSGSGKSTLMNLLGCLDRPTSGTYLLNQRDVSQMSQNDLARVRNLEIGFVFQSFNLLPRTTALQKATLRALRRSHPMQGRRCRVLPRSQWPSSLLAKYHRRRRRRVICGAPGPQRGARRRAPAALAVRAHQRRCCRP